MEYPNDRFMVVYDLGGEFGGGMTGAPHTQILVDRMIGVQYLWRATKAMNAGMGGLTVLVG